MKSIRIFCLSCPEIAIHNFIIMENLQEKHYVKQILSNSIKTYVS
jgi:hypothetical protein